MKFLELLGSNTALKRVIFDKLEGQISRETEEMVNNFLKSLHQQRKKQQKELQTSEIITQKKPEFIDENSQTQQKKKQDNNQQNATKSDENYTKGEREAVLEIEVEQSKSKIKDIERELNYMNMTSNDLQEQMKKVKTEFQQKMEKLEEEHNKLTKDYQKTLTHFNKLKNEAATSSLGFYPKNSSK